MEGKEEKEDQKKLNIAVDCRKCIIHVFPITSTCERAIIETYTSTLSE